MVEFILGNSLVSMLQLEFRVSYCIKTGNKLTDIPKHYDIILATHSVASKKIIDGKLNFCLRFVN